MNTVKRNLSRVRAMKRRYRGATPLLFVVTLLLIILAAVSTQNLGMRATDSSIDGSSSLNDVSSPKSKIPMSQNSTQSSLETTTSQTTAPCTVVDVSYGIVQQPAIWLYEGQTEVSNHGITGKKQICTDAQGRKSEKVISKAFDEYINVGTKQREQATTPTPAQQYTFNEALYLATQSCQAKIPAGSWDSTDMSDCKNTEIHKYGY